MIRESEDLPDARAPNGRWQIPGPIEHNRFGDFFVHLGKGSDLSTFWGRSQELSALPSGSVPTVCSVVKTIPLLPTVLGVCEAHASGCADMKEVLQC